MYQSSKCPAFCMKNKNTIAATFPPTLLLVIIFYSAQTFSEFSGTLTGATDYFWRGYSKTDGDLAIRANLDYEHESGLFLGISVINIDFGDDDFDDQSHVEITPYLGWTYNLDEDWRIDLQWTRYLYDGKIFGHESDYNEFYFLLHYRDLITLSTSFSEDFYNHGHVTGNYEITARYPITDAIEMSAGIGYSQVKPVLEYDYLYWNAGFTYYYKFAAFDFRYVDSAFTSDTANTQWPYDPEMLDPTFIFSISVGF